MIFVKGVVPPPVKEKDVALLRHELLDLFSAVARIPIEDESNALFRATRVRKHPIHDFHDILGPIRTILLYLELHPWRALELLHNGVDDAAPSLAFEEHGNFGRFVRVG